MANRKLAKTSSLKPVKKIAQVEEPVATIEINLEEETVSMETVVNQALQETAMPEINTVNDFLNALEILSEQVKEVENTRARERKEKENRRERCLFLSQVIDRATTLINKCDELGITFLISIPNFIKEEYDFLYKEFEGDFAIKTAGKPSSLPKVSTEEVKPVVISDSRLKELEKEIGRVIEQSQGMLNAYRVHGKFGADSVARMYGYRGTERIAPMFQAKQALFSKNQNVFAELAAMGAPKELTEKTRSAHNLQRELDMLVQKYVSSKEKSAKDMSNQKNLGKKNNGDLSRNEVNGAIVV